MMFTDARTKRCTDQTWIATIVSIKLNSAKVKIAYHFTL